MVRYFYILGLIFSIFIYTACGGGGGGSSSSGSGSSGGSGGTSTGNTVNTAKLVDTPFVGLTIGDDLDPTTFFCDAPYKTDSITSFPIKVFAAFFTATQEEYIQEGVDLANEGLGFEAYEITDEWSDDVRVFYKVDQIDGDYSGYTYATIRTFNDNYYSETQMADWAVEIRSGPAATTGLVHIVAHELGHASGLRGHFLINYGDNTIDSLESCSLMSATEACDPPALTDYNTMMSMQGQIMQDHLTEVGDISGDDPCDSPGSGGVD